MLNDGYVEWIQLIAATLVKFLSWRLILQGLSWSIIELSLDKCFDCIAIIVFIEHYQVNLMQRGKVPFEVRLYWM